MQLWFVKCRHAVFMLWTRLPSSGGSVSQIFSFQSLVNINVKYIYGKLISNTELMRQVVQKSGLFVIQQDFSSGLTSHTDVSLHSALKHVIYRFYIYLCNYNGTEWIILMFLFALIIIVSQTVYIKVSLHPKENQINLPLSKNQENW